MKTLEQVKSETSFSAIAYSCGDFLWMVKNGCINEWDGIGYYHDGEQETDIPVLENLHMFAASCRYPYVIWYGK